MPDSNTARKHPEGKPFTKGDPRINRRGRPKTFDALRELSQEIAHEPAKTKDGQPVVVDGHIATNAEIILRLWASSQDFRKQQGFMEIAFGKVPQETRITGAEGKPLLNMQEVIALMAQADKLLAEGGVTVTPAEDKPEKSEPSSE
jgi:hypothetical protein